MLGRVFLSGDIGSSCVGEDSVESGLMELGTSCLESLLLLLLVAGSKQQTSQIWQHGCE
jgi:hypothetical protein